jgi:PAS domain S-box-containing protein
MSGVSRFMSSIPSPNAFSAPVDPDSQTFLRKMAGLTPGIIYVFNQKTMSNEYANRSIAELLGYSPQDVLDMGDDMMPRLMYPDDLIRMSEHFANLADLEEGQFAVFEYRVTASDDRRVWLRSIDTVFDRMPDGSVLRHLGIAFDISSEKNAIEALAATNSVLEERVAARTAELFVLNQELEARVQQRTAELHGKTHDLQQLTHAATHDLKVPINNICSLAHMLEDAEHLLPDEHVETLQWLRTASRQARDKLDALVWVAQLQDRPFGLFAQVDIAQATERALVALHFDILAARARVSTDFAAVRYITFLPQEFENMMESLINNALRYAHPDRRPTVIVRSALDETGIHISVSDNGSGLNLPHDEAKVFGLFQRAHVTPEGSGVALYTIRRMMQKLGGQITVQPNVPFGCTFILRFPATTGGHDD